MVAVRFYQPDVALRPYLSSYYLVDADVPEGEPFVDHLHPEWANLRILKTGRWAAEINGIRTDPVPRVMLAGFTSHTIRCETTAGSFLVIGAGILPSGWSRFFGIDARRHADRVCDAAEVLGAAAQRLVEAVDAAELDDQIVQVLDAFFLDRLQTTPPPPPVVGLGERALMNPEVVTTEQFASAMGVSVRQAERLSSRHFGFAPKLLLRRQRFLRTLARLRSLPRGSWGEAIDLAYHDQSHFIRDFQRFMGMSPSAYFALARPILARAADLRQKVLGAAVQGLHEKTG